jgi:hypothetical protein
MTGDYKIELTVDTDGSIKIDVNGVRGKSCLELTKQVEEALGQVTSRKNKAEYSQTSSTSQHLKVTGK